MSRYGRTHETLLLQRFRRRITVRVRTPAIRISDDAHIARQHGRNTPVRNFTIGRPRSAGDAESGQAMRDAVRRDGEVRADRAALGLPNACGWADRDRASGRSGAAVPGASDV